MKHPPGPPDWSAMKDKLGLTDSQLAALNAHSAAQKEKMQSIRADSTLSKEQKKAKAGEVMKAGRAEVEKILTPDQLGRLKDARKNRPMAPDWTKIKSDLGLTDGQLADLREHHAGQKAKMDAIRSDDSLSKDQKKAKAKEVMKSGREEIGKILTPEQMKKFEQMMPRGPKDGGKHKKGGKGDSENQPPPPQA